MSGQWISLTHGKEISYERYETISTLGFMVPVRQKRNIISDKVPFPYFVKLTEMQITYMQKLYWYSLNSKVVHGFASLYPSGALENIWAKQMVVSSILSGIWSVKFDRSFTSGYKLPGFIIKRTFFLQRSIFCSIPTMMRSSSNYVIISVCFKMINMTLFLSRIFLFVLLWVTHLNF